MAAAAPMYRRDRARLPADQRRRQIIEVTTRLIAERGFWGLSMQDVADGCGLTVPGLLHHVGSKNGLLVAVLEHRDAEDARALLEQLGLGEHELPLDWSSVDDVTGVDLRRLAAALVRRNATQPEIVRLFAVLEAESLAPSHPAHAYFMARQQQAVAAFAALAKGFTTAPESLARQIVALMDGLQIQWLRDPGATDLVQEWEAAAEVLFGSLEGKAPAVRPRPRPARKRAGARRSA
jgi:AcrR family transcriptional regulator